MAVEPDRSAPSPNLLMPHHQRLIDESAVAPEVAAERGYRTVTSKAELKSLGFADSQCRIPALLVPIYGVGGDIVTNQVRPDQPRRNKDGKAIKYETPRGSTLKIDVPPRVQPHLGNPKVPLYITEGARKADSAASKGLACIALMGVYGWRGKNTDGGKAALPDWHSIAINGRTVYIVFDSDVTTKPAVRQALRQLKEFLEQRGAKVKIVYLPSGAEDEKTGLDDFLALGKNEADLLALARDELPPNPTSVVGGAGPSGGPQRTDTGNAERLVDRFGRDLHFCHPFKKWLTWDGTRWASDEHGKPMSLSKEIVRSIISEAAACRDPAMRDALIAWAMKSEKVDRRKAMVELAKSEKGVPILPAELDQHEFLLNCPNGTLDLRTGVLRPHGREDCLTKRSPTPYVPDAECPRFLEFLDRVLPDPEIQEYLQRYLGYALTGDVSEQQMLVAVGDGLNGKSTLFCLIQYVYGRAYAIQVSTELLLAKDHAAHPTELADLFGIRLAIGTEAPRNRDFNEPLVKLLTGGESVRARRMREDFWEFAPTHKLVLVTNYMPTVSIGSFAIQRRLHVLHFDVRIPPTEVDKRLMKRLRAEREGVLAWCVRGCRSWLERGLDPPPGVVFQPPAGRATPKRPAEEFIALFAVPRPGARTRAADLYAAFTAWCADKDFEPCSPNSFGAELGRAGFGKRKSSGHTIYLDMALAEPDKPPQGPSGSSGDLLPVERLGVTHEGLDRQEVPGGPQRSLADDLAGECRCCGKTRRWRLRDGAPWTCGTCHAPSVGADDVEWSEPEEGRRDA